MRIQRDHGDSWTRHAAPWCRYGDERTPGCAAERQNRDRVCLYSDTVSILLGFALLRAAAARCRCALLAFRHGCYFARVCAAAARCRRALLAFRHGRHFARVCAASPSRHHPPLLARASCAKNGASGGARFLRGFRTRTCRLHSCRLQVDSHLFTCQVSRSFTSRRMSPCCLVRLLLAPC